MQKKIIACTFFGHRNYRGQENEFLKQVVIELIEKHSVNCFYVGHNGGFDREVLGVLLSLKEAYTELDLYVVLAYYPPAVESVDFLQRKEINLLYPEELESVPKKFAISYRNNWMVDHSDYVVGYINRSYGGAYAGVVRAGKKGKTVFNIAQNADRITSRS